MTTSARSDSVTYFDGVDGWMNKSGNPSYSGNISPVVEIPFQEEHPLVTRVSFDKQCFAVGLDNGSIKMFNVVGDKVKMVYNLSSSNEESLSCTDMEFVPFDNNAPTERKHLLVATYAGGYVKLWHYTSPTTKSQLISNFFEERIARPNDPQMMMNSGDYKKNKNKKTMVANQIMACSVSLDGTRCISGGEDGCIRVYDLIQKKKIGLCSSTHSNDKMDGHIMKICALQYHPRGLEDELYSHIFVSAGWDDTIQIWDDQHNHSLWQYYGPHICGTDAIDIDPEQNHMVVSSWRRDKTILEIWRFNEDAIKEFVETKQVPSPSQIYQQYAKPISKSLQDKNSASMGYVSKWLGDQYIVFGGSNVHMLKIIDRSSFNTVGMVTDLPNGVYSVAYNIPDVVSEKRPIRIGFCSGTKLYIIRLDRK